MAVESSVLRRTVHHPMPDPKLRREHRGHHALRVLMYAVGASGVGQTRRAVRIGEYLCDALEHVRVVVVSGVPAADRLFSTEACRVVTLPEVLALSGGASDDRTAEAATAALLSFAGDFDPDILVSTTHAGVRGELRPVLRALHAQSVPRVLALRDVYWPPLFEEQFRNLDAADFTRALVAAPALAAVPPAGLLEGALGGRTTFVGYLRPSASRRPTTGDPEAVWCQVGGGRDGLALASAFLEAAPQLRDTHGDQELQLVTGCLMPANHRRWLEREAARARVTMKLWIKDMFGPADVSRRNAAMVSMAGYNSCVEAAWFGFPAVVCPRPATGDGEQHVRAKYFDATFANINAVAAPNSGDIVDALTRAEDRSADAALQPLWADFAEPEAVVRLVVDDLIEGG